MKIKRLLIIFLVALLALSSCNLSRNNVEYGNESGNSGGDNGEGTGDDGNGGDPPLPPYFYDDPTSPLQGKTVLAFSWQDFPETFYAVTKEGVFLQDRTESPKWRADPLPFPAGFENSEIIDAMQIESRIYLAVDQAKSGNLHFLLLNPSQSEELTIFQNLYDKTEGAKFMRSSKDSLIFASKRDIWGNPIVYNLEREFVDDFAEITPHIKEEPFDLTPEDDVIGALPAPDLGRNAYYFLIKQASNPTPYQLWTYISEDEADRQPAIPLFDSKNQIQTSEIRTFTLHESNGFQVTGKGGQTWHVDRTGEATEIIPASAGSHFVPYFWAKIAETSILASSSSHGYLEKDGNRLVFPHLSSDPNSYRNKKIETYTITGIYDKQGIIYLSTSNGLWEYNPSTKKWKGI